MSIGRSHRRVSRFDLRVLQENRATHFKKFQSEWDQLESWERSLETAYFLRRKFQMYLERRVKNGKPVFDEETGDFICNVADRETEKALTYWRSKIKQHPPFHVIEYEMRQRREAMCQAQEWARVCHQLFVEDQTRLENELCP